MCCKGSIKQWRKDAISQQGALVFEWKKVHIEQLDKLSIIWHCIYFMSKVKRLTMYGKISGHHCLIGQYAILASIPGRVFAFITVRRTTGPGTSCLRMRQSFVRF